PPNDDRSHLFAANLSRHSIQSSIPRTTGGPALHFQRGDRPKSRDNPRAVWLALELCRPLHNPPGGCVLIPSPRARTERIDQCPSTWTPEPHALLSKSSRPRLPVSA